MCCILGYTAEESCYLGLIYCDFPLRAILYPLYCTAGMIMGLSFMICEDALAECGMNAKKIADIFVCVYPYRSPDICCCWNTPQDEEGPVNLLLWERKINQSNKELLSQTS
jgi:hypothetical protein